MLVWQGLGAFVFVVPFFVWLGSQLVATSVAGADAPSVHGQLIAAIALLISAGPVWLLARRFDARPGWQVIDKATGHEVTIRQRHAMFFVQMRYWAVIYVVVGFALLAQVVLGSIS